MRARYVASYRRNARAMIEIVRSISETSEGACSLECLMLRCSIWYFIERIKQVQVISLQRDIKVSCKTVDGPAELEFNAEVKGSAILRAKSTKIDFRAARMKHFFVLCC